MHDDDPRFSNAPRVSGLHPVVYRTLAGCVVWWVGALWLLFSHDSETAFQIAAVTFFAASFVAMPWSLRRIAMAGKPAVQYPPFSEWRHARFETASGSMSAGDAAFLVLLAPIGVTAMITIISALHLFALNG
ncbi:MAG TPA: hypothetical protein VFO61_05440 [Alphaproteobacteria bacterium]|nr:hypothetical protein [Alphaproteobacteria bacterium]